MSTAKLPFQFTLRSAKRKFKVRVFADGDAIRLELKCSKYGVFGDEDWFARELQKRISHLDSDPRPTVMHNPWSGQKATVFGNAKGSVTIIQPPKLN